ncbi:Glucose-methanol-choline oxidoreductase [Microbacterium sp. C448]|uniref:GMC family oxidoreductase N-terminal domain-containing protein n=1 Tax=Microbacterium sp. C448 TaxID=1177594 RepID=UPI0003DE2AD7|nr:GMC family oxidoreductase N-terminal domain-containing protein [Microbacterium sp. C448]CDK00046.1 Glucose-methanol-choline oxidoreductase [Microbacterium sp. C448]
MSGEGNGPDLDVIVVGSGGAGAPLAARLSEDPKRRVLVLEAGPVPRSRRDYPAELLDASTVQGAMPGYPHNWAYLGHLTPELPYLVARGRILGGSTALNGAYFVRATPEDFAAWAEVGGPDWTYEAVLPAMRRLESDPAFADDPRHGDAGPIPIERAALTDRLSAAFRAAALEQGFADEPDKNVPGRPGVGPVPSSLHRGMRWNTGLAYLLPVLDRPNLEVRGDARVVRVLIEDGTAVGVELAGGEQLRAREVVLAAGAVATPQLLLVSGVGPREQLEGFGIPVEADLPVGAAFSDHPDIAVGWRPRASVGSPGDRAAFPACLNFASAGAPHADLEILLSVKPLGYLLTGSAHPLGSGVLAALRHPLRTIRALVGVSARRMASQLAHRDDLQLIVAVQQPEGRGSIRLVSTDPNDGPRIDYRYLETPSDRARMREGLRVAVSLLRSNAFAPLFGGLTELDDATLDDDDGLDDWARAHLGTAIHMCGTAPMGPAGSPGAVVDGQGRVHGIAGLRVADTSILPTVPSRGPAATAVLIGERIADFIARGD